MKKASNKERAHGILLVIRFLEKYSVSNAAETSGESLLIPEKLFGAVPAVLRGAKNVIRKQSNKVILTQLSRKDSGKIIIQMKHFGKLKAF